MNRYEGNTGRVTRLPEPPAPSAPPWPAVPPGPPAPPVGPPPGPPRPGAPFAPPGLGRLLPGLEGGLEADDLLLLLILYLMYRESGDSELLIIMGAMFLL